MKIRFTFLILLAATICSSFVISACNKTASPTSVDTTKTAVSHKTLTFTFKGVLYSCTNVSLSQNASGSFVIQGTSTNGLWISIRISSITHSGNYTIGDISTGHLVDVSLDYTDAGTVYQYIAPPPDTHGGPTPTGTINIANISPQACKAIFNTSLEDTYNEFDQPTITGGNIDISN